MTSTAPDFDIADQYGPDLDDEAMAEYVAHCAREAALVRTRERRRCYDCRPLVGQVRRVVGHFTSQPRFDPTLAYRLTCGHATIDV